MNRYLLKGKNKLQSQKTHPEKEFHLIFFPWEEKRVKTLNFLFLAVSHMGSGVLRKTLLVLGR
jgi:hypothetical protein